MFFVLLISCVLLDSSVRCCDLEQFFVEKQVSVEDSAIASGVVFRGLTAAAVPASPDYERGVSTAHFELINTYKGAQVLDTWVTSSSRQVNVTLYGRNPECGLDATTPAVAGLQEYIVFSNLVDNELRATAVAKWDDGADQRVWAALGWSKWSAWSACSVSCSTGIQQRVRHCLLDTCPGFNVEQRHCNLFGCIEAANPLELEEHRFYHPSKDRWQRVPDRTTAWRLSPNSYIWVPSSQLFSENDSPVTNVSDVVIVNDEDDDDDADEVSLTPKGNFPKEFALFVTLRLHNDSTMGTIFSLRSKRRQDTYLSLEVAAGFDFNLVHATENGTDVVRIPTNLADQEWHQIALGIRDDSVVESYVDCEWSRTDILRRDALDIPEDSDLIIGYLFSGDLEQLTIVPDPSVVSLQCSAMRTPIIDPSVTGLPSIGDPSTAAIKSRKKTSSSKKAYGSYLYRKKAHRKASHKVEDVDDSLERRRT